MQTLNICAHTVDALQGERQLAVRTSTSRGRRMPEFSWEIFIHRINF